MRMLISALAFVAACTPIAPVATEPVEASAVPAANDAPLGVSLAPQIAPGVYRIRTAAKCQDIAGSTWALSTNFEGGCNAMVNLVACAPAPGGLCDCIGYPQGGGSGNGCDGINGGGMQQGVEWR